MTKSSVLLTGAVALLFAALGQYLGTVRTSSATIAPGPAATLFAQTLPDASGAKRPMVEFRGKPLLINFWAPWCAPCVEEMPELSELARQQAAAKVQVQIIGIGIDSPTNIAAFSTKYKISYPIFVAGMGGTDLALQFGNKVGGLPFTVLIGADGQVLKTYQGRLSFDVLRADLRDLKH